MHAFRSESLREDLLKAISFARSAQTDWLRFFHISKMCMNSTMPQVSKPPRGIGVTGPAVLIADKCAAGELP